MPSDFTAKSHTRIKEGPHQGMGRAPGLSRKQDSGATAGMPLFLQGSFLSGANGGVTPEGLRVGRADDPLEQEADRQADHVLHMKAEPGAGGGTCRDCQERQNNLFQLQPDGQASASAGLRSPGPPHGLGPGQPLAGRTRNFFEPRFGRDFGDVRVHTGPEAEESARRFHARAFTVGRDVAFAPGWNPDSGPGRKLLAHELAHVVQQSSRTPQLPTQLTSSTEASEREVSMMLAKPGQASFSQRTNAVGRTNLIYRQAASPGATPGQGEGVDLIFIIRAPDDQFTADVTSYVKTVLEGQTYKEVDNLDEIFDYLALLKPRINAWETLEPGIKVRRIRIVAHGSTTGGVKLTPKGESERRWFSPDEVSKFASRPSVQSTLAQAMEPGAVVEFWGCNLGKVPEAMQAWSQLFQASFVATTDTFKTGFDTYYRRADQGEQGEAIPGQKGTWVRVSNTSEIDARGKGLQTHFRTWLLQRYAEMVKNGDILPLKTVAEQVDYMRDLFNRSNGDLKHILVERESNNQQVRPGDQDRWIELWTTQNL